jgi:hypothetical protein
LQEEEPVHKPAYPKEASSLGKSDNPKKEETAYADKS